MALNQITVYCGSNPGKDPGFLESATELGKLFLQRNIGLIYGGGDKGLMGQIAHIINDGGGKVTGVIPEFMCDTGLTGKGPGKLIFMETMHQRKQFMCEQADAFIALPGGFGTMEELVEMITWVQIGLHDKPVGILNTNNFYKGFLDWVAKADGENLIYGNGKTLFVVGSTPEELLDKLTAEKIARTEKLS